MAKKFKIEQKHLMWIIGILFVMSVMPGQGTKASEQQALVTTEYICTEATDCPTCVGGWFGGESADKNNLTFFGELAYADCIDGKCEMTEYCLVWDCPEGSQLIDEDGNIVACTSVKQTLLDNTIGRMKENPMLLVAIIGFVVVFLML